MERTKKWPWNWDMLSPLLQRTRITPYHPAPVQIHTHVLTTNHVQQVPHVSCEGAITAHDATNFLIEFNTCCQTQGKHKGAPLCYSAAGQETDIGLGENTMRAGKLVMCGFPCYMLLAA